MVKTKILAILPILSSVTAKAWAAAGKVPAPIFSEELGTAKKLLDMTTEFCVKYSFQVLGGIVIIILGWLFAKFVGKFFSDLFAKKGMDVTISKFLVGVIKNVILVFVALIALGKFGITIAPFIAGLSALAFGASFAVQGPLSNYAAGATLIFTKPFKVGDIVEVAGVDGKVVDITLARTQLETLDGTLIFIPNKHVIGEIIHNYSENKKLDVTVGVSYDADVDKAIQVVKDVVKSEELLSEHPEAKVGVSEFADSSVNIYARLWCKPSDYYDALFSVNKKIFDGLANAGISIPFPQRDVHIIGGGGQ